MARATRIYPGRRSRFSSLRSSDELFDYFHVDVSKERCFEARQL